MRDSLAAAVGIWRHWRGARGRAGELTLVRPRERRLVFESLEPRLLMSADLTGIGAAVQGLLTSQLEPAIVQQVERAALPLIGSQLAALANPVATSVANAAASLGAATAGLTAASSATDLQTALFNALGPNGARLLLNNPLDGDNGAVRPGDIVIKGSDAAPEFSLELGNLPAATSFSLSTDSRLGLPVGLGLNLGGVATVQASETWTLRLDFGVDAGGFFLNPDPLAPGSAMATVHVDLTTPQLSLGGKLGLLQANVKDVAANPTKLSGDYNIYLRDPNGDGHLRPTEQAGVDGQLSGQALVDLAATLSLNGDPRYPSFGTNLLVKWGLQFGIDPAHPETFGTTPDVSFNNVTLKLGSFIGDALNSTLSPITDVLKPVQPLLDVLTARLPVVSDLAGKKMTLLDLFGAPDSSALDITSQLSSALSMVSQVTALGTGINLNLGSFALGASDDIRATGFSLADASPTVVGTKVNLTGQLSGLPGLPGLPSLIDGKSVLQLPFLADPLKAFGILIGKPVDLVSFNPPPASFSMDPKGIEFPIFGPLVVKLSAGLGFNFDIGAGYDTTGLYALAKGGSAADLAKGIFIRGATDSAGNTRPVFSLVGNLDAGAAVDLGVIDAGVAGGVKATVGFKLDSAGSDGKEYLASIGGNPLDALTATGKLEAYLRLFIDIGVGPFSVPINIPIPLTTILDFDSKSVPLLAQMDPSLGDGVLRLNVGPYAAARNYNPKNLDESFAVRHVGGTAGDESVIVEAFGVAPQRYDHVKKIYADAGDGVNELSAGGYQWNKDGSVSLVATQWVVPNPDGFGGWTLTSTDPNGGPMQYPAVTDVQSPVEFHSGSGRDVLVGGAGASFLYAGSERDELIAGTGPATLRGGDGNDLLIAGPGADTLDGGAGSDTVSYASAAAGVSVDLALHTAGGAAVGDVLTNVESLQGSAFDDTLGGDDNHNVLDGRGGHDTLLGRGGDDLLIGGAGADVLDGGGGNNSLSYATSPAAVNIDLAADTASGGDAQGDVLIGNFRGVQGSEFDDVLTGSPGVDQITGLGGNDLILGGAGDDHLVGGSGNDRIVGGLGNDTIEGGLDSDTLLGDNGNIAADGTVTQVAGPGGDDQLSGNEGDDKLYGQAGNDVLNGGDGADYLVGGAGADQIGGDAGLDTVSYFDSPAAVKVDLSTQTVTGGDATGDTLTSSIENAEGSAFNDVLIAVTTPTEINQAGSVLSGLAGDDLLIAGPVYSTTVDPVSHKISKFGDTLVGGDGNDTASWENSTGSVVVNLSNSTIGFGGNGSGTVLPGHGELGWAQGDIVNTVENLRGSDFSDMLIGDGSANIIDPRLDRDSVTWLYSSTSFPGTYLEARDFVDGRGGGDTLKIDYSRGDTGTGMADEALANQDGTAFGNVARWVAGADPTVYVAANYLDYVSFTEVGRFDITGTAKSDILTGWSGDDRLHGEAGNDLIVARGGGGDLDGGAGTDTLSADLSALTAPVTLDTATQGTQFLLNSGGTNLRIANFEVLGADGGTPLIRHLPIVSGARFGFSDPELWFITGSGDDRLTTHGRYRDVIHTNGGNDTVDPGLGDPTIEQGFQTGWVPGDQINLGAGDDTLVLDYSQGDTGSGLFMNASGSGPFFPGGTGSQPGVVWRFTAPGGSTLLDQVVVYGEDHVQVTGTNEADSMFGTPNDDILLGRGGDDTIQASSGGGTLDGGSGTDLLNADLSAFTQAIVLDSAVPYSLPGANLKIANFEILGRVDGYGNGGFVTGSGNDVVTTHGRFNDAVFTSGGDDRVDLGLGIDRIDVGGGNNTLLVDYAVGDIGGPMSSRFSPPIFRNAADGSTLLDAVFFSTNAPQNLILTGTSKNDTVNGGNGNDVLTGVNPAAAQPGKGEVDALTGGAGADLFVLGDTRTAYYDDADPNTAGTADFARVRDFNPAQGDVIALHGAITDYRLVATGGGTQIVWVKPGSEPGEVIGLIENPPAGLSLTNGFRFVGSVLQVNQFAPTDSGFTLRFSQALDASQLNLYGGAPGAPEVSDIVLLGPDGRPVTGSVVLDADRKGLTFLRTGGPLAAGSYSLRLAARADGVLGQGNALLDGNDDGVGGDDYVTHFSVAGTPSAVLSVGEIARGPGQTLANPATGYTSPITLAGAAGATQVSFVLHYDPELLRVSGFGGGALPPGSSINVDLSVPGVMRVSITAAAPLSALVELGRLDATVPVNAPYAATRLLHLTDVTLGGSGASVRSDDGLQVVALLGDASGNGRVERDDVQLIQRVAARADTGFASQPLIDPLVLGDMNHDGRISSTDALLVLRLAQQGQGLQAISLGPQLLAVPLDVAELPPLPVNLSRFGIAAVPQPFASAKGVVPSVPVVRMVAALDFGVGVGLHVPLTKGAWVNDWVAGSRPSAPNDWKLAL